MYDKTMRYESKRQRCKRRKDRIYFSTDHLKYRTFQLGH